MDNTSRLSTDTASGRLITHNYTHVKHANARRERIWSNADTYTAKTLTHTPMHYVQMKFECILYVCRRIIQMHPSFGRMCNYLTDVLQLLRECSSKQNISTTYLQGRHCSCVHCIEPQRLCPKCTPLLHLLVVCMECHIYTSGTSTLCSRSLNKTTPPDVISVSLSLGDIPQDRGHRWLASLIH